MWSRYAKEIIPEGSLAVSCAEIILATPGVFNRSAYLFTTPQAYARALASVVPETVASRGPLTRSDPVENTPKLSTGVEDTPTRCGVCKLSEVPYIVVKLSKEKVPSEPYLGRKNNRKQRDLWSLGQRMRR